MALKCMKNTEWTTGVLLVTQEIEMIVRMVTKYVTGEIKPAVPLGSAVDCFNSVTDNSLKVTFSKESVEYHLRFDNINLTQSYLVYWYI